MIARFHRNFKKHYKNLEDKKKNKFEERINLFLEDEFDPALNNHPLRGKYKGYRSINITGDLRAIYKKMARNRAIFIAIDNHNNLYK